jgi:hypothetical protein
MEFRLEEVVDMANSFLDTICRHPFVSTQAPTGEIHQVYSGIPEVGHFGGLMLDSD